MANYAATDPQTIERIQRLESQVKLLSEVFLEDDEEDDEEIVPAIRKGDQQQDTSGRVIAAQRDEIIRLQRELAAAVDRAEDAEDELSDLKQQMEMEKQAHEHDMNRLLHGPDGLHDNRMKVGELRHTNEVLARERDSHRNRADSQVEVIREKQELLVLRCNERDQYYSELLDLRRGAEALRVEAQQAGQRAQEAEAKLGRLHQQVNAMRPVAEAAYGYTCQPMQTTYDVLHQRAKEYGKARESFA